MLLSFVPAVSFPHPARSPAVREAASIRQQIYLILFFICISPCVICNFIPFYHIIRTRECKSFPAFLRLSKLSYKINREFHKTNIWRELYDSVIITSVYQGL
ncbi:BC10 family protein [Blautia sp. RD014234]|nr:BC10 family protein [Blautia parvula]